jgi:hypothetical protein
MNDVTFIAAFDDDKTVELKFIKGGYFHIFVNRFYWGMILNRSTGWAVVSNDNALFTSDDMDALLERVGLLNK